MLSTYHGTTHKAIQFAVMNWFRHAKDRARREDERRGADDFDDWDSVDNASKSQLSPASSEMDTSPAELLEEGPR